MKFDINDIINILPHSYPFLLVDRVIECNPGNNIKAVKNVTFNEQFFIGHFPGNPIMPGVLVIESLAQASAICLLCKRDSNNIGNRIIYFMSIKNAKFRKPVIPGDRLILQSKIENVRLNAYKFKSFACVEEQKVAEAIILAILKAK